MGKRLDRAFDVMRERNRRSIEKLNQQNKQEQQNKVRDQEEETVPTDRFESGEPAGSRDWDALTPEEKARAFHAGEKPGNGSGKPGSGNPEPEKLELEKGDLPAMILSALLVFGPVFLVLFGILALAWVFLH